MILGVAMMRSMRKTMSSLHLYSVCAGDTKIKLDRVIGTDTHKGEKVKQTGCEMLEGD